MPSLVSLRVRCSNLCSCSFSSCSFRSRTLSAWALAFWAAMPASRDLGRVTGCVGCAAWVGRASGSAAARPVAPLPRSPPALSAGPPSAAPLSALARPPPQRASPSRAALCGEVAVYPP